MSLLVVDASVGVKWLVPEPHTADALRVRDPGNQLHIPTFFDVEVANMVWKKLRQGLLSRTQANLLLGQLPALPLTRYPEAPLLTAAFDLAVQAQRTVYDCLYRALAVQLGGRMVTADERLVNSLARTPLRPAGGRARRPFSLSRAKSVPAWGTSRTPTPAPEPNRVRRGRAAGANAKTPVLRGGDGAVGAAVDGAGGHHQGSVAEDGVDGGRGF